MWFLGQSSSKPTTVELISHVLFDAKEPEF